MNSPVKPLEFGRDLWRALMGDLHHRGRGRRESGAFLLGCANDTVKVVCEWLTYDQLDPKSLDYAIVRLDSSAFTRLWEACAARRLEVVADIHTHPRGPTQSRSDRAYPMISLAGHIALIAPNFARGSVTPKDISFNVYQGGGRWHSYYRNDAAALIRIL